MRGGDEVQFEAKGDEATSRQSDSLANFALTDTRSTTYFVIRLCNLPPPRMLSTQSRALPLAGPAPYIFKKGETLRRFLGVGIGKYSDVA